MLIALPNDAVSDCFNFYLTVAVSCQGNEPTAGKSFGSRGFINIEVRGVSTQNRIKRFGGATDA